MQGNFTENLISPAAADRLLAAHEGDLALLYLFIRRRGSADLEQAAGELCRTLSEMQAAYEKLSRMGLTGDTVQSCELAGRRLPEKKLLPADELPEYSAEDVVRRTAGDSAFSAILREAEGLYGKRLGGTEVKKLLGIYDYLSLPAEVMMELLHFCVQNSMAKGRMPSMRYIEKEATKWANLEIFTLEQAEEYIGREKQRREDSGRVAELLGIRGRELSPTEKGYIGSWIDMGFDLEVIAHAFDRTVTNTGGLKWGYMNKILSNWKEMGLFDLAQIEEKDSRRRTAPARNKGDKSVDTGDLDVMFKGI